MGREAHRVTDYNQGRMVEQYKKAKAQPYRSRIEAYSFMKRIGDPGGKNSPRQVKRAAGNGPT
jgi:hypothetical protein